MIMRLTLTIQKEHEVESEDEWEELRDEIEAELTELGWSVNIDDESDVESDDEPKPEKEKVDLKEVVEDLLNA